MEKRKKTPNFWRLVGTHEVGFWARAGQRVNLGSKGFSKDFFIIEIQTKGFSKGFFTGEILTKE